MSVAEGREAQLRRAVVRIVDRGRRVVGTGFFVTRDLVATCAHVVREALRKDDIEGGEQVEIQLLAGMPEGPGFVLATVEREYLEGVGPRHGPSASHPRRAYLCEPRGGDVGWPLRRFRLLG